MEYKQQLAGLYIDNYRRFLKYSYCLTKNYSYSRDLLHDVFLKLLEKPITTLSSLNASYIYRCIFTQFIDSLRKKSVKIGEVDSLDNLDTNLNNNSIAWLMDRLNELVIAYVPLKKDEKVLWDCIFICLPLAEIATSLGIEKDVVRKKTHRLRVKISKHLEGKLKELYE